MKVRYCPNGGEYAVTVGIDGTILLFDEDEKEIVLKILEGLSEIDEEVEESLREIICVISEKRSVQ